MRVILGFISGIVVLILAALLVIWTGSYNIAATDRHFDVVRWGLDKTMRSSVERRAEGIRAPERFSDQEVRSGFASFDAMCVHCHGAPGVERSEWAEGLRPQPPELSKEIGHWKSAEVFWIVKHGIKMSGMPAFGPTHDDPVLCDIVAFVEQLPSLTPEAYAQLRQEGEAAPTHSSDGSHTHTDSRPAAK